MKRREFITLLGGVAIAWHALNDHRILLGSDWRCCKQTSRGGVHDDTQIEDPLSHSTGTVFSQSDLCSRVYLQGIYWRRGFVFGISRYMSTVAQPDEEVPYPVRTAFQRCLGGSTDTLLVLPDMSRHMPQPILAALMGQW